VLKEDFTLTVYYHWDVCVEMHSTAGHVLRRWCLSLNSLYSTMPYAIDRICSQTRGFDTVQCLPYLAMDVYSLTWTYRCGINNETSGISWYGLLSSNLKTWTIQSSIQDMS